MLAGPPKRSEEPLRVVFFTASYFVLDGVTLTIRKILEACKQAGHETMVITAAPIADTLGELGELAGENLVLVPGMPVPLEGSGTSGHYGYALGLGLSSDARSRLAEFKPHVAHFTVCDLLGMDGVAWAKANRVALVGTVHSNYCDYIKFYSAAWWLTPVLRRYIQQFYGAIPTTFVPTKFMKEKLTDEGYGRFTDMQVWGRGIDLDRFNPKLRCETFRRRNGCANQVKAAAAATTTTPQAATHNGDAKKLGNGTSSGSGSGSGSGDESILIIWVGRLVPEKRPDIWRDVFLQLVKEGFPVKGLVVGVGPCQGMLEALPGVTVAGWLSGKDLSKAYASADILLFPSDVETFGNVTLEALGSGVPAVVEESCSSHLVTDGVEGFTVHQGIGDPSDKQAYEACMLRYLDKTRKLLVDKKLRERCGSNALLKAATYSNGAVQGRMIENYFEAYRSQIGEFGSGSAGNGRGGSNNNGGVVHGGAGSSGGGCGGGSNNGGSSGCGGSSSSSSCVQLSVVNGEDPNDKTMGRRSKRQMVRAACARVLCCCWPRSCAQDPNSCEHSYWTAGGRGGLRADAVHFVWCWLARIVIFVLWLLLGLPHVTSTNLADTNIRQASETDCLVTGMEAV